MKNPITQKELVDLAAGAKPLLKMLQNVEDQTNGVGRALRQLNKGNFDPLLQAGAKLGLQMQTLQKQMDLSTVKMQIDQLNKGNFDPLIRSSVELERQTGKLKKQMDWAKDIAAKGYIGAIADRMKA